jgi:hypothetical protein
VLAAFLLFVETRKISSILGYYILSAVVTAMMLASADMVRKISLVVVVVE